MNDLYEIEIRNGKPVLSMSDLAAMLCGRLLLAWGELDFRVEALLEWTWGEVANRQEAEGKEHDPQPIEGRSSHRLKLLRRYFGVICDNDKQAMSRFDTLLGEQKRLEKIRSAIAHGLTLGSEMEGDFVIRPWTFGGIEGERRRDTNLSSFTFAQMQVACVDVDATRQGFEILVEQYTKPFIYKTMALRAGQLHKF